MPMSDIIIALNAGSSSIKLSVCHIQPDDTVETLLAGHADMTGPAPHFTLRDNKGTLRAEQRWNHADVPYATVLGEILKQVDSTLGVRDITAIGHRIVHGGPAHSQPEYITPALVQALTALTPLAPLHMPHNLEPIEALHTLRPDLPQVACFDTAFHHDMPFCARSFALPHSYMEAGIRRYGFHGLSYEYIVQRLRQTAPHLATGRVIAAHLGSGASLCAIDNGKSIDTTMGFSPLDGLVMSTRCGALDPAVVLYLQNNCQMDTEAVRNLLYQHSGLLALSNGLSGDIRTLLASSTPEATRAIEVFIYHITREAAAMACALGGVDALIFSGGIGENQPDIRASVVQKLGWLGLRLDTEANAKGTGCISTTDSPVEIHIIPTDEDAMIALHTRDVLRSKGMWPRSGPEL